MKIIYKHCIFKISARSEDFNIYWQLVSVHYSRQPPVWINKRYYCFKKVKQNIKLERLTWIFKKNLAVFASFVL